MLKTIKQAIKWWKTWGSLPCIYWIRAADNYRSGDYKSAVVNYQKGLEKYLDHPARFCALMDQSYCLVKLGKIDQAILKLQTVIKQLPESKEAHIRLANLYRLIGDDIEATWLLRKTIKLFPYDSEVLSLFIYSIIDSNAPSHIVIEAREYLNAIIKIDNNNYLLNTAFHIFDYYYGNKEDGRVEISKLACKLASNLPAKVYFAKILISEGQFNFARIQLSNALRLYPNNSKILSLLSETYLREIEDRDDTNLKFSLQLAISSAQNSYWLSPRELHILAEVYYSFGDKFSALLVASKAQDISKKRSNSYPNQKELESFVSNLASGTLA